MELVLGISGGLVMLGALVLAFVRPPQWMGDSDPASKPGQTIRRWGGFQRVIRRCINAMLGLIGALVFACAFVPQGRAWMAMWLFVFLALITALLLAALDAVCSVAGYRQAMPEAARRSLAGREPHP
ncbi:MAG: hypothetical protein ACTHK7_09060 [Aureliella sp.]